jgi:hypothetical protein
VVVGVRLTAADVQKLDRLAAQTFRGRGDLLRLLIARAEVIPELGAVPVEPAEDQAGVPA